MLLCDVKCSLGWGRKAAGDKGIKSCGVNSAGRDNAVSNTRSSRKLRLPCTTSLACDIPEPASRLFALLLEMSLCSKLCDIICVVSLQWSVPFPYRNRAKIEGSGVQHCFLVTEQKN